MGDVITLPEKATTLGRTGPMPGLPGIPGVDADKAAVAHPLPPP